MTGTGERPPRSERTRLRASSVAAVPLRIAPLVIIGLILLVLSVIAAATL